MVMGSEGEGGTHMHSINKIDLMGQAERYQGTKTEGKRVVGEKTKGGSKPESQCNDRKTKHKQYTG